MGNESKRHTSAEWSGTLSGKLAGYLAAKAAEGKVPFEVLGKGKVFETFQFNHDQAHLRKQISGGRIGETPHNIHTLIEAYEYKRKPWWSEAIDAQGIDNFLFLDTPVQFAAKDAGIAQWERLFRPSVVMKEHGIYTGTDEEERLMCQIKIRRTIIDVLTRRVGPHYDVCDEFGSLRLRALTDEARESRFVDNEAYHSVLPVFGEAVPDLEMVYSSMAS
jgi:hypothetical protein